MLGIDIWSYLCWTGFSFFAPWFLLPSEDLRRVWWLWVALYRVLLNPFQMELLGSKVKHISRAYRLIQRKGNERGWGEEKAGSATKFGKVPRE